MDPYRVDESVRDLLIAPVPLILLETQELHGSLGAFHSACIVKTEEGAVTISSLKSSGGWQSELLVVWQGESEPIVTLCHEVHGNVSGDCGDKSLELAGGSL